MTPKHDKNTSSFGPALPQHNRTLTIDEMIIGCLREGAIGSAHLLRAMKAGKIALLPISTNVDPAEVEILLKNKLAKPTVILVGDDDGMDRGPAGFPAIKVIVRWSKKILLHASGAEIWHYDLAVKAASENGHCLLIECNARTLSAWMAVIAAEGRLPQTFLVLAKDGQHPISGAKGKVQ
jgi:hypothetical protein